LDATNGSLALVQKSLKSLKPLIDKSNLLLDTLQKDANTITKALIPLQISLDSIEKLLKLNNQQLKILLEKIDKISSSPLGR
jgi:predicted  nucleic acid-binding Zn-ribbon protein